MFDYQVSKHPHFDEACRAFALRHNLACSVGEVESDVNVAGTLAARAMQQAIKRAVTASAVDDREYLKYCLRN